MRMLNEATEDAAHAAAFFETILGRPVVPVTPRRSMPAVPAVAVGEIADWNADVERRKAEKRMRKLRDRMLAAEQR